MSKQAGVLACRKWTESPAVLHCGSICSSATASCAAERGRSSEKDEEGPLAQRVSAWGLSGDQLPSRVLGAAFN